MNMISAANPTSYTPMQPVMVAKFNGTDELADRESNGDIELERFSSIFSMMLGGSVKGGLTEFLFFTPNDEHDRKGTYAWDDVCVSPSFGFGQNTATLINEAVANNLIDFLPQNIKIVDNGPGTLEVFKQKTGTFFERVQESNAHEIQSLVVRDKSTRFATDAAFAGKRVYKIGESIAIKSDFINDSTRFPEGQGTPVVLNWGGAFANAPEYEGGPTSLENLERTFHNMHKQHGLGSYFLVEIDLPDTEEELMKSYDVDLSDTSGMADHEIKKREAFRKFILGAFYRATYNGTITDPSYDVDENMTASTTIEQKTVTIKDENGNDRLETYPVVQLNAIARKEHTIKTVNGDFVMSPTDKPKEQILSHKWTEAIWSHAARSAGGTDLHFFRNGKKAIMFGKFGRKLAA